MKKNICNNMILIGAIFILTSGCASYLSVASSKNEIRELSQPKSSDDPAIRSMPLNDGSPGVGVDVSNIKALTKHPVRQLGAAGLDILTGYGAYLALEEVTDSGSSSDSGGNGGNTSGGDTLIIQGDGNVINNRNTTTPSERIVPSN